MPKLHPKTAVKSFASGIFTRPGSNKPSTLLIIIISIFLLLSSIPTFFIFTKYGNEIFAEMVLNNESLMEYVNIEELELTKRRFIFHNTVDSDHKTPWLSFVLEPVGYFDKILYNSDYNMQEKKYIMFFNPNQKMGAREYYNRGYMDTAMRLGYNPIAVQVPLDKRGHLDIGRDALHADYTDYFEDILRNTNMMGRIDRLVIVTVHNIGCMVLPYVFVHQSAGVLSFNPNTCDFDKTKLKNIRSPFWYVLNEATLATNQYPLPMLDPKSQQMVNVTEDIGYLTRTHTEKAKNWIFVKDCEAYFLQLMNAYLTDPNKVPKIEAKERVKWWDKKAKKEEIEKQRELQEMRDKGLIPEGDDLPAIPKEELTKGLVSVSRMEELIPIQRIEVDDGNSNEDSEEIEGLVPIA